MSDRPDEPIVSLRELGDIQSPEVVRGALRRFRRRLLVRIVVIALIVGAWFGVRALNDTDYIPDLFAEARGGEAIGETVRRGAITATVIEAKQFEREGTALYGLRLVVTADGLRRGERIVVEAPQASCFPGINALDVGPTVGDVWGLTSGRGAQEVLVLNPLGRKEMGVTVGAVSPLGNRTPQPLPPLPTVLSCDAVMDGFPGDEHVRYLGTIKLDPEELGISEQTWKERGE